MPLTVLILLFDLTLTNWLLWTDILMAICHHVVASFICFELLSCNVCHLCSKLHGICYMTHVTSILPYSIIPDIWWHILTTGVSWQQLSPVLNLSQAKCESCDLFSSAQRHRVILPGSGASWQRWHAELLSRLLLWRRLHGQQVLLFTLWLPSRAGWEHGCADSCWIGIEKFRS